MSSIVGGCMDEGLRTRSRLALRARPNNAMRPRMHKPLLALAAALLATPAWPDTLVTNVNGIQVAADGQLQHFTGLIIGKDGKVRTVLAGPPPPIEFEHSVNGDGRTLLPGLIDAHGHVMDLGFAALRLDVTGTRSIG